jgi:hypothetical protein
MARQPHQPGSPDQTQSYDLTVNGAPVTVRAAPTAWLMNVIRDDLRLTGTKDGCAKGHCGSCTILLDGEAVRACLVPMKRVRQGAEIETLEGLADPAQHRLHPIQQATGQPVAALPGADSRIVVYCGGQIPFGDRRQIAASLAVPESDIRVINCLIGGALGGKEDVSVQIHVALLAQPTGRPVKMVFSREESIRVHPKRHAMLIRMKTGATREGALVAHQALIYGDAGAHASLSHHVTLRATTHAAGP